MVKNKKVSNWSINDIDWNLFEHGKVDENFLDAVKVACLIEARGKYYGDYLQEIFSEDSSFSTTLIEWGEDEKKHGDVLEKWIRLADPEYDFSATLNRFIEFAGWPQPKSGQSIRGSLEAELISRCIVESATSSFYFSSGDETKDPLLKEIVKKIAGDEVRHYKLFKKYLDDNIETKQGKVRRIITIYNRIREAEDDQLTMAYFCVKGGLIYDRNEWSKVMQSHMYKVFRKDRLRNFIYLNLRLLVDKPNKALTDILTQIAWTYRSMIVKGSY